MRAHLSLDSALSRTQGPQCCHSIGFDWAFGCQTLHQPQSLLPGKGPGRPCPGRQDKAPCVRYFLQAPCPRCPHTCPLSRRQLRRAEENWLRPSGVRRQRSPLLRRVWLRAEDQRTRLIWRQVGNLHQAQPPHLHPIPLAHQRSPCRAPLDPTVTTVLAPRPVAVGLVLVTCLARQCELPLADRSNLRLGNQSRGWPDTRPVAVLRLEVEIQSQNQAFKGVQRDAGSDAIRGARLLRRDGTRVFTGGGAQSSHLWRTDTAT